METIGKNNKVLHRELDRQLARPRRRPRVRRDHRAICRARRRAGSPKGTGPELGKTGAKPEIWQNRHDFAAKLHNFQVAAQAVQRGRRERRRERDQGALRRPRRHLQGVPRQVSRRRCTTERAGRKQPVWDLPVRLVHWLLAGADRVQLVVGPQPPHRLAHLVGLRDPDPAALPPAVGRCRKLDRALRRASSADRERCCAICAAAGAGSATRRWARSASSPCSPRSRSRSGSA